MFAVHKMAWVPYLRHILQMSPYIHFKNFCFSKVFATHFIKPRYLDILKNGQPSNETDTSWIRAINQTNFSALRQTIK